MSSSQASNTKLCILYGSQTGIAESIAKRIQEDCINKKYASSFDKLNNYKKYKILEEKVPTVLVIVCSTTGNGDTPENAELFSRFIKRKAHPEDMCSHIEYMILGLGDSNYDKFCNAPKEIDKRLQQLSAKRLIPHGYADDAVGLEQVVEPWLLKMWATLEAKFAPQPKQEEKATTQSSPQNAASTPSAPASKPLNEEAMPVQCFVKCRYGKGELLAESNIAPTPVTPDVPKETLEIPTTLSLYSEEYPYHAQIIGVRYLTSSRNLSTFGVNSEEEKVVLHMELSLGDSGIQFQPGDAIGVKCNNPDSYILEMLKRLQLPGAPTENSDTELLNYAKTLIIEELQSTEEQKRCLLPTHIKTPASLYEILSSQVDIASNQVSIPQIRAFAQYCTSPEEREELRQVILRQQQFRISIVDQSATVVDVLRWFPSCKITIEHFLQVSSKLQPRYYSIANSPLTYPNEIHFAFNLVHYSTPPPYRLEKTGLCTVHYLLPKAQKYLLSEKKVTIPIFLKQTPEFKLPQSLELVQKELKPIIMIGPGTGISPFRGFIQHRLFMRQDEQIPDSPSSTTQHTRSEKPFEIRDWLFHGCRRFEQDCLYREEMMGYDAQKKMKFIVASSREAIGGLWYGGVYVQDLMREYGKEIINVMEKKGGYVYVCGDAQGMAKQVHRILIDIAEEELGVERSVATNIVTNWQTQGRYQTDVWT